MRLILSVLVLLCPLEALAAPGYTFEKVVRVGDPAPGTGETFTQISPETIDSATGRVYFWGCFGSPSQCGTFSWADGTVQPEVLPGDPAPATVGGTYVGSGEVSLNASGEMVFMARVDDGATVRLGLFLRDGSGDRVVVLQGDPMPGLPGLTFDVFWQSEIDAAGRVVFEAYDDISTPTVMMIARWDDGAIDPIVTTGDAAPPPGGGTIDSVSGSWLPDSYASDAGEVVIDAYTLPAGEYRFLLGGSGGLADLLSPGAVLPTAGGGSVTIDSFDHAYATTATGDLVFVWFYEVPDGGGGTTVVTQIAKLASGVVYPIVSEGDPVPGQPGHTLEYLQLSASGATGDVGFIAETGPRPDPPHSAYVTAPGGVIREVCRFGEAAVSPAVTIEFCEAVLLADSGEVLLQVLEDASGTVAFYLARPVAVPATTPSGLVVLIAAMTTLVLSLKRSGTRRA